MNEIPAPKPQEAHLQFHYYPSDSLTKPCEPCPDDFYETFKASHVHDLMMWCTKLHGYAIAANQVGINQQFFFLLRGPKLPKDSPQFIINPEIVDESKDTISFRETCLSLPNFTAAIRRSERFTLLYNDGLDKGTRKELKCRGLLARIIHHEVSHLKGRLITDEVSPFAKDDADKYLKALAKSVGQQ
jgi:peptide deformylase